ncbi:hypothetical protein EBR77_03685 [bacterium]|nr:hypothetical protein [bacterium]NBX78188.1 hypothetical protein [bacterium]
MIYFLTIIQIIIESFPVSSSGHVALSSYLLSTWPWVCPKTDLTFEYIESFLYAPTAIILLLFFFFDWWRLLFQKDFSIEQIVQKETYTHLQQPVLFYILFSLCFLPLYFLQSRFSVHTPLYVGFMLTQICLIWMSNYSLLSKKVSWSFFEASMFAVVNGAALFIPGLSRLGSSMLAGVLFGYSIEQSFVFSWMLFFPMTCVAFIQGLMSSSSLLLNMLLFDLWWWITIVCAMIGAWAGLYLVRLLIRKEKIYYLAWYMCIPTVLAWYFQI